MWEAAVALASGGLPRWRVVQTNDLSGVIDAEAAPWPFGAVADVRVEVGLDANAQTRVDVRSRSRKGGVALGSNRRRIRSFLSALDRRLVARPHQILDGSKEPSFTA